MTSHSHTIDEQGKQNNFAAEPQMFVDDKRGQRFSSVGRLTQNMSLLRASNQRQHI
jgi:hypothetical protein